MTTARATAGKGSDAQWWPRPARPQSVAAELVEQVRAALFAGVLVPGDFVGSESQVAKRLGTSRVPVRDAFQALQAMGIITVKTGVDGGARIAAGDPNRFADALAIQFKLVGISPEELLEAQTAVEGAAAELAAAKADAQDFADLRGILAALQASVDDPVAFTREGLRFHCRIVQASANRALIAYSRALADILYPEYYPQTTRELAMRVVTKHYRVLKRLEARDGPGARTSIIEHLTEVRNEIIRRIRRDDPPADPVAPPAEKPAAAVKPRRPRKKVAKPD